MYCESVHTCNHGTGFGEDGGRKIQSLRLVEQHGGSV